MKTTTIRHLFLLPALLLLLAPGVAFAWGAAGHDAIVAIAEANLTPAARANIEKYTGGHSIVYYASWMDHVRHTNKYRRSTKWHTAPVDSHYYYTSDVANEQDGDAITAIEESMRALRNYKKLSAEAVEYHIKILVHAIGDYHCPVHVKYLNIRTAFNVTINGRETTYHSVWDGAVVTNRQWGYLEWVHQMNRLPRDQIAKITSGTPRDWFHQTALDSRVIYTWVKPNQKLEGNVLRDFLNKATPLAESQIQKAGYRLAAVFNYFFAE